MQQALISPSVVLALGFWEINTYFSNKPYANLIQVHVLAISFLCPTDCQMNRILLHALYEDMIAYHSYVQNLLLSSCEVKAWITHDLCDTGVHSALIDYQLCCQKPTGSWKFDPLPVVVFLG